MVELENGSDLGSALEKLAADYPAFSGPSVFARGLVLVDGTESRNLDGAGTLLSEGSTITLIPVVHGG